MKKDEKRVLIALRISQKLYDQVAFRAKQENIDFSKYCRRLIERGISVEAYKEDVAIIGKIVREQLEIVMEPLGGRIIKLMVKIGKVTGGLLFTTIKLLMMVINPNKLPVFKDLLVKSMEMGVEFMKVKDFEVDEYLTDGEKLIEQSQKI